MTEGLGGSVLGLVYRAKRAAWLCGVLGMFAVFDDGDSTATLAADWVGRASVDRESDTVDRLAELGKIDQALRWCDQRISSAPPRSETHAWWLCKRADVKAYDAKQTGIVSDDALQTLIAPLEQLLRQYPAHSCGLFLRAKGMELRLQAITSQVVQAAIEASREDRVDGLLRSLIRFDKQISALMDDLDSDPTFQERRSNARTDDAAGGSDEQILTASLSTLRLQAAILRTELFEPSSRDYVSASAKASSLADEVRILLPVDSPARLEVDLLQCQSLLRGRRLDEATQRLQQVGQRIRDRGDSGSEVNRWLALVVELHLLQSNLSAAQRRLDAFYGNQPQQAPVSLPLDLARLKWMVLVAKDVSDSESERRVAEASAWIESIERRHDRYARRRAEALLLSQLGSRPGERNSDSNRNNPPSSNVNASLMAIQGRKQIREGNTLEGSQMLTAAALAESNAKSAVDLALQAAAGWEVVGRPLDAANLLATVSTKHSQDQRAPSLHLQAAVLATKSEDPWSAQVLLDHLRSTASTWPANDQVVGAAKSWAVQTLSRMGRDEEAAQVVDWTEVKDWSARDTRTSIDQWIKLLRSGKNTNTQRKYRDWLVRHIASKDVSNEVKVELARGAVLGLAASDLRQLSPNIETVWSSTSSIPEAVFFQGLQLFRLGKQNALSDQPSDQSRPAATWRLMEDGREDVDARPRIDALLSSWTGDDRSGLDTAERLVWVGETDQARQVFQDLIQQSDGRGTLLKSFANRLLAINDPAALKMSVEYWDMLAAGLQQGSRDWHSAKLAAAETLVRLGQKQEAIQRLRYVWLTNPPKEADLRARYEKLLR